MMEHKLLKDLKRPFKVIGFTRIDETPIHRAVREALANCIVNADFNFLRGIVIKKDFDYIIVENPGSIITGKNQMLKGGISDPRNKIIMKMFNLIKIGEHAGSGVPDIFSVWKNEGFYPPTVEELYNPDRTILTLPFLKHSPKTGGMDEAATASELGSIAKTGGIDQACKASELGSSTKTGGIDQDATASELGSIAKTGGMDEAAAASEIGSIAKTSGIDALDKRQIEKTIVNKKKILAYIFENGMAKSGEIAQLLGLSEFRVRDILADLTKSGMIKPCGNGKARKYILAKKID